MDPDWVSESLYPPPIGKPRRYAPWAYEYQGARCFPWCSEEKKLELAIRERMKKEEELEAKKKQQELEEAEEVTKQRKQEQDRMLKLMESKLRVMGANRPSKSTLGKLSQTRHKTSPAYDADADLNTHRLYAPLLPDPEFDYNHYPPTVNPPCGAKKYDPIVYEGEATLRDRSMMISKSADFQPRDGRPRFERPYMNFANSMWMRYPHGEVY